MFGRRCIPSGGVARRSNTARMLPPRALPAGRLDAPRWEPILARTLAARGESPAAFGWRCIRPACVVPRSNTARMLPRLALTDRRIATLGASCDFHHGLLDD